MTQLCDRCMTRSPDGTAACGYCGADLAVHGIAVPDGGGFGDNLPTLDQDPPGIGAGVAPPAAPPVAPPVAPIAPPVAPSAEVTPPMAAPSPPVAPPAVIAPPIAAASPGPVARPGVLPDADTTSPGPRVVIVDGRTPRPVFPDRLGGGTGPGWPDAGGPGTAGNERGMAPDEGGDELNDLSNIRSEAGDQPPPTRLVVPPRLPDPDEKACPRCREPNPVALRFCIDCGAAMGWRPPDDFGDDTEPVPPPDTWWRRLTGTTAHGGVDRRTPRQKARDSGQARAAYGSGRTLETRLAIVGVVMAATAAAVAGAVLFLRGGELPTVSPVAIQLTDPGARIAELPPEAAFDGKPDTVFGLAFTPGGPEPDSDATLVGGIASFTVQLGKPVVVQGLELDVVIPPGELSRDPGLYATPARLELLVPGAQPVPVLLDRTPGPHRVKVTGVGDVPVDSFTVRLLSVRRPSWDTYDLATFVEIKVVTSG